MYPIPISEALDPTTWRIAHILSVKPMTLIELAAHCKPEYARFDIESTLQCMVEYGYVKKVGKQYMFDEDFNMYAGKNDSLDLLCLYHRFMLNRDTSREAACDYIQSILNKMDDDDRNSIAEDYMSLFDYHLGKETLYDFIVHAVGDMYAYVEDRVVERSERFEAVDVKTAVAMAVLVRRMEVDTDTLERLFDYVDQKSVYVTAVLDSAVCKSNDAALDWVISMKNSYPPDPAGLDLAMEHAEVRGNDKAYRLLEKAFNLSDDLSGGEIVEVTLEGFRYCLICTGYAHRLAGDSESPEELFYVGEGDEIIRGAGYKSFPVIEQYALKYPGSVMFRFRQPVDYSDCIETAKAIDEDHCACYDGSCPVKVKKVTIGESSMLVLIYDCESG